MKRFLFILVSMLAVSCGPSTFTMNVEMRGPSRSGFTFGGKNISVSYPVADGDSVFLASVSEGFAKALEADYFGGEEGIGIYEVSGDDLSEKDSLVNIVVETGADVAFLFKVDSLNELSLYVYDSMSPEDSVYRYTGGDVGKRLDDKPERLMELGESYASIFLSTWKEDAIDVLYYDMAGPEWYSAAEAAGNFRWKEAMDIWMGLLKTNDMQKRGCAEYNIALACHMLGQDSLALEWLDRADKDFYIYPSAVLRKKITEK